MINNDIRRPMKLFLTSAGLTNKAIIDVLLAEILRPVESNKVLVVAHTSNAQEEFYANESKQSLIKIGFKDVLVVNINQKNDISSLGDFDIIYVCGGNTFLILNKLKETGLSDYISDQVNKGAIYVGVSAGSIIACQSIEVAGWGSEGDKNDISLKDLSGLNFVDISIFPHYRDVLHNEVEQYKQRVQNKVFEINDDQAIFVKGNEIIRIGY
jgi:dipeptidase E